MPESWEILGPTWIKNRSWTSFLTHLEASGGSEMDSQYIFRADWARQSSERPQNGPKINRFPSIVPEQLKRNTEYYYYYYYSVFLFNSSGTIKGKRLILGPFWGRSELWRAQSGRKMYCESISDIPKASKWVEKLVPDRFLTHVGPKIFQDSGMINIKKYWVSTNSRPQGGLGGLDELDAVNPSLIFNTPNGSRWRKMAS